MSFLLALVHMEVMELWYLHYLVIHHPYHMKYPLSPVAHSLQGALAMEYFLLLHQAVPDY